MSGPAAAPQIVDFSALVAVINALPHAQVIDAIAAGFVSYSRGQVSVPQIQTPGGTLRQGYLWAIPRRRRGLPKSQSLAEVGPVHSTPASCIARPRSQRRGAAAAKVGWWMRLMSSKRPSRRRQPTWPQLLPPSPSRLGQPPLASFVGHPDAQACIKSAYVNGGEVFVTKVGGGQ